jgi:Flp pilus assembly protein TadG
VRRFGVAQAGAAAVEFALILPVMLLVYIGTTEGSALIVMDRKVQTVAGVLGDLVARANTTLSQTDMVDFFRAATAIMNPYSAADLVQVVTGVNVSSTGVATVAWSKKYASGAYAEGPYAENSSFTLPPEIINIALDDFVIVSEASSSYTPLYGFVIDRAIGLHRANYFLPRFEGAIAEPN